MQVTLYTATLDHADIPLKSATVLMTQKTYRDKKCESHAIWFPFTDPGTNTVFLFPLMGSVLLA